MYLGLATMFGLFEIFNPPCALILTKREIHSQHKNLEVLGSLYSKLGCLYSLHLFQDAHLLGTRFRMLYIYIYIFSFSFVCLQVRIQNCDCF